MSVLHRNLQPAFLICAIVCLTLGCSTLKSLGSKQLPTSSDSNSPPQKYTVQIQPAFGPPKSFEGILTDSTTVQSALEAAGALKNMRGMEIDVHRQIPESGQIVKLQVAYDVRKKSVQVEQDYAIHPNDVIIVRPKSDSPLSKAISKILREK